MNERPRVAVISDVHGNGRAYDRSLQLARERGFDQLVLLGDLLTYGVDPVEVLTLTADAIERDGAILLIGNHDQLYFDLAGGETSYYDKLPGWLRETVDWTVDRVDVSALRACFAWREELVIGDVFFAHANPFAHGDWTYLNKEEDFERASAALEQRGYRAGVFGHTHRQKVVEVDADRAIRVTLGSVRASAQAILINPGSVGQPRDQRKVSTFTILTTGREGLGVESIDVPYDINACERDIMHSGMSEETCTKLLGYLK